MIIPLFGTSLSGRSKHVTAQDRVNVYLEVSRDPEKGQVAIYGFPGLVEYWDTDTFDTGGNPSDAPIRALVSVPTDEAGYAPEYLLAFKGSAVLSKDINGVERYGGTLFESDGITATDDTHRIDACITTKIGDAVAFTADSVTPGNVSYLFEGATLVDPVTDGDALVWTSCTSLVQKVIATTAGSGKFYFSDDGDSLSWDALSFQSAETVPDSITRVLAHNGSLLVFGARSLEFFTPSGDADTPFAPVRGAPNEWGLVAKWSVAVCSGSVVFLARNGQGQAQIVRLTGYTAQVISDPEIESQINELTYIQDATGLAYSVGGHTFYQINFTVGNKSFVFDTTSGVWSRLTDIDGNRHRAEIAAYFNGQTVVSDYETGKLYTLDPNAYDNDGEAMPREVVTRHFFKDYERVIVDELQVDFEVGVGNDDVADPQVMLQVSKDNGRSWGTELWASLGEVGETTKRVVWRRLGMGRDWTFKLRVTDAAKFVISSASLKATPIG